MAAPLPPQAADALRPELPRLADDIIAAIAAEVPGYARPMEGRFGQVVRFGVEVALNRFVDLLLAEDDADASARETYVRLGAGEFRAGRSLDALLAAYRVGARLAWRRFVEAGRRAGFPPDALYDLGEAIFAYIDEISAESAEGYAEAQSEAAGESQRRRQGLLRLLVQEPPAPADAVRTAAQAAGWALPRRVAAVVAAEADQPQGLAAAHDDAAGSGGQVADAIAARLARRLGPGALGAAVGGLAVVLLPDPEGPGRRRALEVALDGELAAIGPAVPWTEAGASLRRAAAAFRLAAQGRLDGQAAPGSAATAQTERTPPVAGGSAAGALDERASSGRGAGSPRGRLGQATRGGAATAQAGRTLPAAGGPAAGRRSTSPARVPPPSGGQTAPSPSGQAGAPSGGQSVSRLVVADQHLPALLLAAEPGLAADLVRSRLAPLDGLGAGARDRLAATLRAWLDRPGQVQAVAAALDVHPQTVRYRLKQLRELFGPRLEDPEARFELALALRAADAVRYT